MSGHPPAEQNIPHERSTSDLETHALAEGIDTPTNPARPPLDTRALAERVAELAWERKALDVRVLRVLELVQYTDWFVIASGRSDRQVAAIRDHIRDELRAEGRRVLSIEGSNQNQWVVMDYGDLVVHIFYEPVRAFYELEKLWGEAPELPLEPPEATDPPTTDQYGDG